MGRSEVSGLSSSKGSGVGSGKRGGPQRGRGGKQGTGASVNTKPSIERVGESLPIEKSINCFI